MFFEGRFRIWFFLRVDILLKGQIRMNSTWICNPRRPLKKYSLNREEGRNTFNKNVDDNSNLDVTKRSKNIWIRVKERFIFILLTATLPIFTSSNSKSYCSRPRKYFLDAKLLFNHEKLAWSFYRLHYNLTYFEVYLLGLGSWNTNKRSILSNSSQALTG